MNAEWSLAFAVEARASWDAGQGVSRRLVPLEVPRLCAGKLGARTRAVLLAGRCSRLFAVGWG